MYQKPVRVFKRMDSEFTVLITGFEPFGDHETNISQLVVSGMAGTRLLFCPWTGSNLHIKVETDVLTVDSKGAQRTSDRLLSGEHWDAILHVGLCDSCEVPRIERLAQDTLNMRLPDNAGRQVVEATIDGAGERGCWMDLTVWDAEKFPTNYTLSVDAGAYLCNETYHATLKALCQLGGRIPLPSPALFLHLPSEKHLSLRDGEAFVDVCIAHMLRPYPTVPVHVVAAALPREGGYLITRRSEREADAGRWEFPGGKCDPGEDWRQAIVRELEEELAINVHALHPIGSWYRTRGESAFVIHLVACTLDGAEVEPSLTVHDSYVWATETTTGKLPWAGRDGEMYAFLQEISNPR